MKKQLIIFYGGHHVSCYKSLKCPLKKEIKSLRKITKDIFFIMENGGSYPFQIEQIMHVVKNTSEEEVYNKFIEIADSAFQNYLTNKEKTYSDMIENKEISITLPDFDIKLIKFALKKKLIIIREEPKYKDFLQTRDYYPPIPMHIFNEIRGEFYKKYGKSAITLYQKWDGHYKGRINELWKEKEKFSEFSFIEQIKKYLKNNKNHSFVIIRGSLHKNNFEDVENAFKNEFIIKKHEYGEQVEDRLTCAR